MLLTVCDCKETKNGYDKSATAGYYREVLLNEEGLCTTCKHYTITLDSNSERAIRSNLNTPITAFAYPAWSKYGVFSSSKDFHKKHPHTDPHRISAVAAGSALTHKEFTFVRGDVNKIPSLQLARLHVVVKRRLPIATFDSATYKYLKSYPNIKTLVEENPGFQQQSISNCLTKNTGSHKGVIFYRTEGVDLPENRKVKKSNSFNVINRTEDLSFSPDSYDSQDAYNDYAFTRQPEDLDAWLVFKKMV